MRTTITLDDELLEKAGEAIGSHERSAVLHEALRALIQREAARRLIQLGGSVPEAKPVARRRLAPASTAGRKRG